MAARTGMGNAFYVDGSVLSNDTSALTKVSTLIKPLVSTGIDSFGNEKLPGGRDGAISWVTFMNNAAGKAHPVLSALPTADRIVTWSLSSTLGDPAANLQARQLNYDLKRPASGDLTLDVNAVGDGLGLNWGQLLTAGVRNDVAPTTGTGANNLASSAFGIDLYVQVIAFAGTSATFTLLHSTDNGGTDPFVVVNSFPTPVITAAPQAVQVGGGALTKRQWLRIDTSGAFTVCNFVAVACRREAVVVY